MTSIKKDKITKMFLLLGIIINIFFLIGILIFILDVLFINNFTNLLKIDFFSFIYGMGAIIALSTTYEALIWKIKREKKMYYKIQEKIKNRKSERR